MSYKENIILTAIDVISKRGNNFSMDELSSMLKMSKRTVYEKVGSKENLIILCQEYLKEQFDLYYDQVTKNKEVCFLDRFEILINFFGQNWFMTREDRAMLNRSSSLISNKIDEVRNYCLNKSFDYLEQNYNKGLTFAYNRELFNYLYLSALISLNEDCRKDPTLDFKKQQSLLVNSLICGIVSTNSTHMGGSLLQRLLSRCKIGLILFNIQEKINPIFVSPGYDELFEDMIENDILTEFIESSKQQEKLKSNFASRKEVSFDYEIDKDGKTSYYSLKALPINWQMYDDVYLAVVTDVTETKNRELQLEISENKFNLALKQTSLYMWEYSVENRWLILSESLKDIYSFYDDYIIDVAGFFIGNKIIHPDYTKKFEKFYRGILAGQRSGECKIKMVDKFGNFKLFKLSYKTIFDCNDNPITAVGVVVPANIGVENKFDQEEQMISFLKNEIEFGFQYNIESEKIEKVFGTSPLVNKYQNNFSFEGITNYLLQHIPNESDKNEILNVMNKKVIYDFVQENRSYNSIYFRIADESGNISWKNLIFRIITRPAGGDDYLFAYILEADKKHKLELKLPEKVEYDITTKLFVKSTFKRMVNFAINEESMSNDCALIIIECVNLSTIKMQYGLNVAEKLLVHFSRVLKLCFSNQSIIGLLDGSKIGIFFPKVDNLYELRDRISEVITLIHNSYVLSDNEEKIAKVYYSIIASTLENANYHILYDKCTKLLDELKRQEDEIITYNDNIDYHINYSSQEYNSNDTVVYEGDGTVLNEIITSLYQNIISLKDPFDIINETLKQLNYYYSAYKTSVFVLSSDKQTIKLHSEFTIGDILSFDKVEYKVDEIPGLSYCSSRQQPVIIKTNYSQDELLSNYYYHLRLNNINLFYAMPLIEKNETVGFLTISNATDHLGELSLFKILSQIVNNEIVKKSLVEDKKLNNQVDFVSKLYNYNFYRTTISRLKNSALSSLGVAFIKLNDLRQMNIDHGNEYSDRIIDNIADILREKFRMDSIFRIDSEIFVILIPDINYEAFIERFNDVVNNINNIEIGLISNGQTWTDTDIDVEKLINHAEELMIINKNQKNTAEKFDVKNDNLNNLNDAINRNWFTFFLQPKVDLSTGKVSSAESLVRMVHPTLGVISPAKIIPILEKNKMVSYVDFYILELVCQTLKKWKEEGKKLIPISVNYSRVTLLENDIVERTKNVITKYDVDESLIEIEITETIGNMEQKTISELAEKFIAAGIKLAIDDFGSKYSSLSTLSLVPFNVVKVDKSIINDLVVNPRSKIIVEQIINICKGLNMKSVAEGIETERQWAEVKRLGFDLGQGYYFEKPIPIKEFEEKFLKDVE